MAFNDRKKERIRRVSQKAGDYEELSGNCAQGTLAALQEEFGLPGGQELLKAAAFFPGVASHKETCGALLGGLMALGLAYGRENIFDPMGDTPEAIEKYNECRLKAYRYYEAFKEEFGSTMCGVIRPLLMGRDYDTIIPEERKQFIKDGGRKKCRVPPETAARIAAQFLLEDEKQL
ncbi:MAG: C-GCAxxG-C-C family (seleno)protein [Peptococcaceae bacterium]|nr:C-GCAxxG-C-C family protein [Peptococcaceae bacterium]MDH7523907.1 C-GCAxxG-C-C family (seleno)protein [Peptococcaceae bacterium]